MAIEFSHNEAEERIVTTTLTREDDNEPGLRPKRLTEYTGQEKAKENLSVYIQAALQRKEAALTLFIKNVYAFEYLIVSCNVPN